MLPEADYDITEQAMLGGEQNARFAGDAKLFVVFFNHPRKDEAKTLEEGRPMFKDEIYVRIMVPGDKDSVIVRPARDMDKQRFAKQLAAFEQGEGESRNHESVGVSIRMTRCGSGISMPAASKRCAIPRLS